MTLGGWTYVAGDRHAVVRADVAVLLPADADRELVIRVHEALGDGAEADTLADLVFAHGVRTGQGFAVAEVDDVRAHLMLRSPARAAVDGPVGRAEVDGALPLTTTGIDGAVSVELRIGSRVGSEPSGPAWPVSEGVVFVDALTWASSAVRPPVPVESSVTALGVTSPPAVEATEPPVPASTLPIAAPSPSSWVAQWERVDPVPVAVPVVEVPEMAEVEEIEAAAAPTGVVEDDASAPSAAPAFPLVPQPEPAAPTDPTAPTFIDVGAVPGAATAAPQPDGVTGRPSGRPAPAAPPTSSSVSAANVDSGVGQSRTRLRAGLPTQASGPGILVQAARCPAGHLTSPLEERCRICRLPVSDATTWPVPRPVLGRLVMPEGAPILLDRDIYLGREPLVPTDARAGARAVTLRDSAGDVSRQHASITLDDWRVVLTDLGSTNHTEVIHRDGRRQRLASREPFVVELGTVVVLAEVVEIHLEAFLP